MRWNRAKLAVLAASALALAGCRSCLNVEPLPYPCQPDSGASQCAPAWRCGLAGVCHPTGPDAGAPYPCGNDSDCEAGWRCSTLGICANAIGELLSGTQYEGPLVTTVLSPQILADPPVLFAHAALTTPGVGFQEFFVTQTADGQLEQVILDTPADGGALARTVTRIPAPMAWALATNPAHTLALVDGGLLSTSWDGGGWFVPLPDALALRNEDPGRFAVLHRDAGYLTFALAPMAQPVFLPDACAGDPVTDVVMALTSNGSHVCALATEPAGLFYANYDPSSANGEFMSWADAGILDTLLPVWAPLPTEPALAPTCGVPSTAPVTRLFPSAAGVGLSGVNGDGTTWVALLAFDSAIDAGILGCTPDLPCCGRIGNYAIPPCAVCPTGWQVAETRPLAVGTKPALETRCIDVAGHASWFLAISNSLGATCNTPTPIYAPVGLLQDQVVYNAALPQPFPYVGLHGEVWAGANIRPDQSPRLLGQRPGFFLETDAGNSAVAFSSEFDLTNGLSTPLQDRFLFDAGLGFTLAETRTSSRYMGPVAGRPSWVVLDTLSVIDTGLHNGFQVIAVPNFALTAVLPVLGKMVTTPDGGDELIVVAADTLASADATHRLNDPADPNPVTLLPRLTPLAGSNLHALALLDQTQDQTPDGRPILTEGYLLAGNQLFRVVATQSEQWSATPVAVPGVPLSAWRDQARFRVGMSDGTVYSLPSLVPLVGPLPEMMPQAVQYAEICGEGYVLGQQGLYRLAAIPDGGGLGQWISEPLDAGGLFAAGADPGLANGMLEPVASHLYLANAYGDVLRLDPVEVCQ